jgi:hypothetical protein
LLQASDEASDKGNVVNRVPRPDTTTISSIPNMIQTVRKGDNKSAKIGRRIPAVAQFGLLRTPESAVQHDDKTGIGGQMGGDV